VRETATSLARTSACRRHDNSPPCSLPDGNGARRIRGFPAGCGGLNIVAVGEISELLGPPRECDDRPARATVRFRVSKPVVKQRLAFS